MPLQLGFFLLRGCKGSAYFFPTKSFAKKCRIFAARMPCRIVTRAWNAAFKRACNKALPLSSDAALGLFMKKVGLSLLPINVAERLMGELNHFLNNEPCC